MKKTFKYLFSTLLILLASASVYIYWQLSLSKPQLDGQVRSDVSDVTVITRDQQGIPQITASNRLDSSYALGYLHAQERYFQMDLLRRNSAGELSELFGALALNHDKKMRVHQFRKRVEQFTAALPQRHKEILTHYTKGVNQGLADLGNSPFEYLLLNTKPKPWLKEDSMLVLYSIYVDLQEAFGKRERTLGALKDLLTPEQYQFLTPQGSKWDAAIDGSRYSESAIPSSGFDVTPNVIANKNLVTTIVEPEPFSIFEKPHEALVGSNNWAVSGALSKSGKAIVADDMHLGISVPNIWYRASMRYGDNGTNKKLDGATLPGTPALIVGSNQHIAWGFTNSYGDWSDIVKLNLSADETQYKTLDGFVDFETSEEIIKVKGQESVSVAIKNTQWGPVIGRDHNNQSLVYRWVAHDQEGVNFNLLDLENITTTGDAVAKSHGMGVPALNIIVGDKHGNIAWTLAGAIPSKFGFGYSNNEGWNIPQDWSSGNIGWNGYRDASQYPALTNDKHHRLWTGNSRVVGGEMLSVLGDGGYSLGARSHQIQQNMFAKEKFNESDFLNIQNDDRALFLAPWHKFIKDNVLIPSFVETHELAPLVASLNQWSGHANQESSSYLFVRTFRYALRDLIFAPVNDLLKSKSANSSLKLDLRPLRHQLEVPLWQLVQQQPEHMLPSGYESWNALFQHVVIETYNELVTTYGSIEMATWGAKNTTKIQHPLSKAIPALSWLLDMPGQQVNGDSYMPRVQGVAFGASQRMVITPSEEENAIFHMPGGQSGHPLSSYYRAGHDDWIKGVASPLLPGKSLHRLELLPK